MFDCLLNMIFIAIYISDACFTSFENEQSLQNSKDSHSQIHYDLPAACGFDGTLSQLL